MQPKRILWQCSMLLLLKKEAAKIVVADPRFTRTASKADLHLPLRPGTDIPLILSICNVIVNNKWHNTAFIEARNAWDSIEFWNVCKDYTPEMAEDITGCPQIRSRGSPYFQG